MKKRKHKKRKHKRSPALLLTDLPDELPILSKEDLVQNVSQDNQDKVKYHVKTWVKLCLPKTHYHELCRVGLTSAVMAATWKLFGYNGIGPAFLTLEEHAATWNTAIKALGYSVPQHACVVFKPQKKDK